MGAGRDPYRGLDVSVVAGSFKLHCGVVKGTRDKDGKVMVDVQISTQMQQKLVSFGVEEVRE